ncbi:hypothetical protein Cgig2_027013 [Carnegiea gigantea]|uniref:Uncharacterized protein n=1 Tax=Carnegiea gigantea TaxID=171969 RepID=A0A9Q1JSV3_9CARY|nr:hypothetical protein Cgig2_027013 [Carnegiea gigantea]
MKVANSTRPLSTFDYVPTASCKPSYRHASARSHRRSDEVRETAHPDKDKQSWGRNRDQSIGADALQSHRPNPRRPVKSTTTSIPSRLRGLKERPQDGDAPPSIARRPRLKVIDSCFTTDPRSILMEVKEHLMLKRPQPNQGTKTTQCTEVLGDRDSFERNVSLHYQSLERMKTRRASLDPLRRLSCKEHNRFSQLNRGAALQSQRWYSMGERARTLPHPTMTNWWLTESGQRHCPTNPYLHQELSEYHYMGLFEKAQAPRKRDRPSGTPHFRLWGARSERMLDVPTGYNIIMGQPTFFGSKLTMRVLANCKETNERPKTTTLSAFGRSWNDWPRPPLGKKYRTALLSPAEALVIHRIASGEPNRPCPKAVDDVEEIPLDKGRPNRTFNWAERWRRLLNTP